MLARVAPLLACPVCGAGLSADPPRDAPRRLGCPAGHAYDVARQGHVSLLAGRHRHPGDTAAMVAHRIAFLQAGHYRPIAEAVDALARDVSRPGVVLDIGGGPGWYAAHLLDALPDALGITLDASVAAARRAAKAHPRLASIAADATVGYPLRSACVDVATCVFAPRNGPEIARVLAPGGGLVVVWPMPGHLAEVRGPLGLLAVPEDKADRVARALPGLAAGERRRLRLALALSHEDLEHLALMGPSAFHLESMQLRDRIAALPATVDVTADVVLTAFVTDHLTG